MKVKMAEHIEIYLCEHCAAVHIGMFRNGKLFAEAIPIDAESVLENLKTTIAESERRQSAMSTHKHTDECDAHDTAPQPFEDVAEAAFNTVAELGECMIEEHCPDGKIPDFFGEALLSGCLQGTTAIAFSLTSSNTESIKSFLRDELEHAIAAEEDDQPFEEGTMVQ